MKYNIAIFPSGTEIGLEINNSLKYSMHLNIYGFSSMEDHSKYVYKNYQGNLPFYTDKDFIESLNKFLEEYKIDIIFPAHDDVQLLLTENMEKINAKVVTSNIESVRICRSKKATYKFFCEEKFIPKVYSNIEELNKYPVFIKPDIGQGAKGAKKINNLEELKFAFYEKEDIVICEYLNGEEYTIDCFSDKNGNLRVVKMRNRKRIRNGISVNSENLILDDEVFKISNIINEKLKLKGAWFFQLKKDKNSEYKLLEIAPRISGTMGLSRNLGINFPLLSIYTLLNFEVEIIENNYSIEVDRALISRYKHNIDYKTIYVDLDDTLIINDKVNIYLLMFLYQALNNKKRIILITKHNKDVMTTLISYNINHKIFEKIVHISKQDNKYKYITDKKAIFIDDSFSERNEISKNLNIPVFDCSEVESLIDWRV